MVPISSLWLPIVLSSVIVFIASSIIHMVLGYHAKDFQKVPDEDKFMDVMRGLNIPNGEYIVPWAGTAKNMKSPEVQEKLKKGPRMMMSMWGGGEMGMGKQLGLWFLYLIVVGIFAAYVAGRALGPGATYLQVFRFAGFTSFCCYAVAHWQTTIWYKRGGGWTVRQTVDGLIYGLLTAGVFGWLWPR